MNNLWNKVIYKLYAPLYDRLFNSGAFLKARRAVFENIPVRAGDRVLFVGVGTGADLPFLLGRNVSITAIDLSPDMLEQARLKYPSAAVEYREMDAQELQFPNESFDLVVANLILSVVPDAGKSMGEALRVVKAGGYMVVFDKFAPAGRKLPFFKRMLKPLIALLGTDIGRSFEEIARPYVGEGAARVLEDTPVLWGGMYRKIVLERLGADE